MPRGEQTTPEYDESKDNPPAPPPPPPPPRGEQTAPAAAPAAPGKSVWDLFSAEPASDPVAEMLAQLLAPLAKGTYSITGGFGATEGVYPDSGHIGVDFGTGGKSVPIYAPLRGTVVENGWSDGYGWYMKVQHPDGTTTLYAHMAGKSPYKVGMSVADREQIGMTGTTGHSTGIHLHFEVYDPDGNRYDPMAWLNGEPPGDYQTEPTVKYTFSPSGSPVDKPDTISFTDGPLRRPRPRSVNAMNAFSWGNFNPVQSILGGLMGGQRGFDPVQNVLGDMGVESNMAFNDPVQAVLRDLGVA